MSPWFSSPSAGPAMVSARSAISASGTTSLWFGCQGATAQTRSPPRFLRRAASSFVRPGSDRGARRFLDRLLTATSAAGRSTASIQPGVRRPRLQSQEFGQLDGIDLTNHNFPEIFFARPEDAIAGRGQCDPGIPVELPFELARAPTRIIGDDQRGFGALADDLLDRRSLERDEHARDDLVVTQALKRVEHDERARHRPPQVQRFVPLKTFLEDSPGQIRDQRVDRLVQDQSHGSVLVVIEYQDHGPSKNRSVEVRGSDEKMTLEGLHVFCPPASMTEATFGYGLSS